MKPCVSRPTLPGNYFMYYKASHNAKGRGRGGAVWVWEEGRGGG